MTYGLFNNIPFLIDVGTSYTELIILIYNEVFLPSNRYTSNFCLQWNRLLLKFWNLSNFNVIVRRRFACYKLLLYVNNNMRYQHACNKVTGLFIYLWLVNFLSPHYFLRNCSTALRCCIFTLF